MSTIKERLTALETELRSLKEMTTQEFEECNKRFDKIFDSLDDFKRTLLNMNMNASLSGKDKAAIVCAVIVAVASIIVAFFK